MPEGETPVWINRGRGVSDEKVLEEIEEILDQWNVSAEDVAVVHGSIYPGNEFKSCSKEMTQFCQDRGWRCLPEDSITGWEGSCIILINCELSQENVSRAKNNMIVVTTQRYMCRIDCR